jgi:hypothetical protein
MSHVWFVAQPHCGTSPHALLGAVVVHVPVPPELLVEVPPELLVEVPPELLVEVPPELLVDVPPELLVDVPPELELVLEPELVPPLVDRPGPVGTVTLSPGSVGSVAFFGSPPVGSASVAPCAQAARPNTTKRSAPPKIRPGLIEPDFLTRAFATLRRKHSRKHPATHARRGL